MASQSRPFRSRAPWFLTRAALILALTALAGPAAGQVPEHLRELIALSAWRTLWADSSGHAILVYGPAPQDTAWVFRPDSSIERIIAGYVGGAWYLHRDGVHQTFRLPEALLALPDSVWLQWDAGPAWRLLLEDAVQPWLGNRFLVFPRSP